MGRKAYYTGGDDVVDEIVVWRGLGKNVGACGTEEDEKIEAHSAAVTSVLFVVEAN